MPATSIPLTLQPATYQPESAAADTARVEAAPVTATSPKTRRRKSRQSAVRVRNSQIHGRGVFARRPIKKGARIIEQKGLRITHDECDLLDTNSTASGHTFLFTLNDLYVIDTNRGGNAARWINHGCAPNCESEAEPDDAGRPHKDRIFITAMRDIAPGEELTYDYFITLDEEHTGEVKSIWQCLCGAHECTGTMLAAKADE